MVRLRTVERSTGGRPASASATPRTSSVRRLPRRGKKAWWEKGVQAFQDAPPLWDPFDQDPKLVLNTAESHARDQELGLWRNQAVLAHARAQSAWRALDAEYGGMRERLDVGPQLLAADHLGGDRARSTVLQRPRTANPAGRAPPQSSYLGVGADVLGRGVTFFDAHRDSIGTFRDGAVAGYRDHDATPWQRPRPKSAGVRDQHLPYGGLSRVTETQELEGGPIIKRAAVYEHSRSMNREAMGRGALAGDSSSRSRPISANIRLSGGPSGKAGSVQGGGSEFDLSTCDEDTESVVSFIKDDVSEAEFSTGAEVSPQKDASPRSHGEGGHLRYLPPSGRESGELDGGARMQAKLVKLERLCAEKDSLINDLEAEVRRLDSALGEETTRREDAAEDSDQIAHNYQGAGGISDISIDSSTGMEDQAQRNRARAVEGGEEELRSLVRELMTERQERERQQARAEEAEKRLALAEARCADLERRLEGT